MLGRVHAQFLDLLFPRRCVLCNREEGWACKSCAQKVTLLKGNDEIPALFDFDEPLIRELLQNLKYQGIYEAAETLVDLAKEVTSAALVRKNLALLAPAVLIPVPSSKNRQAKRGYSQTEYVAKALSGWLEIPYMVGGVSRESGETLVGKNKEERAVAMIGAFTWKGLSQEWMDRQWVVVDDTYTTGSTLRSVQEVLQPYTKYPVRGLVMARAL